MFQKIREKFRRKNISIDMFDSHLRVKELEQGELINKPLAPLYPNTYNEDLPADYPNNSLALEKIVRLAYGKIEHSFLSPNLVIAVPPKTELNWQQNLLMICSKIGFKKMFMVEDFLSAAIGLDIDHKRDRKRLMIFSRRQKTYIGLLFKGSAFNVEEYNKSISDIETNELNDMIEEGVNQIQQDLPEDFEQMKLKKRELKRFQNDWGLDLLDEIHICADVDVEDKFGNRIGQFKINYSDSNLAVDRGLAEVQRSFYR